MYKLFLEIQSQLYYNINFYKISKFQQLSRVKLQVQEKEEMIKEKEKFLEQEVANNQEQEKKIQFAERTAAKMRSDYQEAEAQRDQFQSEVFKSYTFIYTLTVKPAINCSLCAFIVLSVKLIVRHKLCFNEKITFLKSTYIRLRLYSS